MNYKDELNEIIKYNLKEIEKIKNVKNNFELNTIDYDSGDKLLCNLYYFTRFNNLDDEIIQKKKIKQIYLNLFFYRKIHIGKLTSGIINILELLYKTQMISIDLNKLHHMLFSDIIPNQLYEAITASDELISCHINNFRRFLTRVLILLIINILGDSGLKSTAKEVIYNLLQVNSAGNSPEMLKYELTDAFLGREAFNMLTCVEKRNLFVKVIIEPGISYTLFCEVNTNLIDPIQYCLSMRSFTKYDLKGDFYYDNKEFLNYDYQEFLGINNINLGSCKAENIKKLLVMNKMFNLRIDLLLTKSMKILNKKLYENKYINMLIDKTVRFKTIRKISNEIIDYYNQMDQSIEDLTILVYMKEILDTSEYLLLIQKCINRYFENFNKQNIDNYEVMRLAWLSEFVYNLDIPIYSPCFEVLTNEVIISATNYLIFCYNYTITKPEKDIALTSATYQFALHLLTFISNNSLNKSKYKILYNSFYLCFYSYIGICRKDESLSILPYCFGCYKKLTKFNITQYSTMYQCNNCFKEHLFLINQNDVSYTVSSGHVGDLFDKLLSVAQIKDDIYMKKLTIMVFELVYQIYEMERLFTTSQIDILYFYDKVLKTTKLDKYTHWKIYLKFSKIFEIMNGYS
jgi:hypothetical protein